MLRLADLVYAVAAILYLPIALYNASVIGKNRAGWGQRFGRIPYFPNSECRIWIHAVSLGEINATPKLVKSLLDRLPDATVVISATTDTGYRRAIELYGVERVFRFPLDFSWVIRRALNLIRPSLIVLVELEVWPNLVSEAARRNVPVVVVNGRLTERSAKRLSWLGPAMRRTFAQLTWVGAQEDTIAARFRAVGVDAPRISVTGSVKWDTALVADRVAGDAELAQALGLDRSRPILVCGSTGPEEEAILLDAYDELARGLPETKWPRLVLIPRKPERFEEVATLIASRGFDCVRRSSHPDEANPANLRSESIILGDTMGELRKFYSLADLVFIGRSLVRMGGSDPMEAAALGKPILIGPHADNFRQPVEVLAVGGALQIVSNKEEFISILLEFSAAPDLWKERGRRGRDVVLANQGATEKTVNRLVEIVSVASNSKSIINADEIPLGMTPSKRYNDLAPAANQRA